MTFFKRLSGQKRTIVSLVSACLAVALLTCTAASAHEFKAGALVIGHPWTRATPPGAKVGGGFMTVKNTGTEPDRLLAVETGVADSVEIHEMKMEGGMMKMRPLAKGIEIKPGETLTLAPGGFHVMFMGLKEPMKQGAMVAGTLVFEKAGRVPVEFKVEPIGTTMPGHEHHEHKGAKG